MVPRIAVVALVSLAFSAIPAQAQFTDDWGEFSREELFSISFEDAPGADAVILLDHGIVRVDRNHRLKFLRHRRTKIFKEEGASQGVVRISYPKGDKLKGVRGHTLIPPGKKIKLKNISEEKHGDERVTVLSFSEVQPGAILEYSYELRADELRPVDPWYFQNDIYTRESRIELQLTPGMSHDAFFGWTADPPPKPATATINDPDKPEFQLEESVWAMKAIPPFRPEPFLANTSDYRTTLYLQLEAFAGGDRNSDNVRLGQFERSNTKTMAISRSWVDFGTVAAEAQAEILKDSQGVDAWAAPALAGIDDPEAAARALYRHVRDNIQTSSPPRGAPASLAEVVRTGQASPGVKNLLLLKLLRDRGIDADAVLIRTRDDGTFRPRYHSLDQLNHTILRVTLARSHYVDASDRYCPFGILPPKDHVELGLLLEDGAGSVVALELPAVESIRSVTTNAKLAENGDLESRSTWRLTGYEALSARQAIAAMGDRAFAEEMLRDHSGLVIGVIEVEGLDDENSPLEIVVESEMPGFAERKGYTLRFSYPFLLLPAVNPLEQEARTYPIEYPYLWSYEEQVTVSPDPEFTLARAPTKARQRIAEAEFSLGNEATAANVSANCQLELRAAIVDEKRYSAVRDFYDELLAASQGRFILKRPSTRTTGTR
jgi:hypothetical protein